MSVDAANDGGDSSITTWCSGRSEKFCWDFDRAPFDQGWTRRETNGAISQSSEAKSPSTALLSSLLPGSAPLDSEITRALPFKATTTRFAADIDWLGAGADAGNDSGTNDAGVPPLVRLFEIGVGTSHAALAIDGAQIRLSLGQNYLFPAPIARNTWTHIECVVTWATNGGGAAQVLVDGTSVFSQTGISTLVTDAPATTGISIGQFIIVGTLASLNRVLFDNVTLDY